MAIPNMNFAGFVFSDDGEPVIGATVKLLTKNSTTQVGTDVSTGSSGEWSFTNTTAGQHDIQISSGSSYRRYKFDDKISLAEVDTAQLNVRGTEGAIAPLYLFADEGEDAGDRWRIDAGTDNVIAFGNDIASQGSYVDLFTITPNSTAASSTVAIVGNATVGGALTVTGTTTLNGNLVLGDAAADTLTIGATLQGASPLTFEGATADGYETTFAITDPTADRTITFPNLTGTVQLSGNPISGTTGTFSGVVDITDTTDSSDASGDTGALRTEGGASIAKKLYVGTDLDVDGTAELDNITIAGAQGSDGHVLTSTGSGVGWEAIPSVSVVLDDVGTGDAASTLATSAGNITIDAQGNDTDIIFKGTDATSDITMLTLDGSEAGAATFNSTVTATGFTIGSAAIVEAELETIDGITAGTAAASKAVVLDGSKNIATIGTIGSGAITSTGTSSFGTGTTIGNLTLANGSITDSGGTLDFGNETLTTTGAVDFGAATVDSLSVSDANITNVADIALDSISADGTDINVAVSDNSATALTIKQGSDAYLIVDTANSSESVSIGTGISGTAITLGHGTSEVTVGDNLTVTGNLTVSGATTTVTSTTVAVADAMLLVAKDQGTSADAVDFGIYGKYGVGGTAKYAGIFRDQSATGDPWTFFDGNQAEPGTTVDVGGTGYDLAPISVGAITAADASTFSSTISAATGSTIGNLTLANGSITDSGGTISFGDENISTTGTATLSTVDIGAGAIDGVTLGTNSAITNAVIDDVAINGKVITMTGDTSDTAVFTAGTNGTLSIVTTDAAAAAANIQITADGTVDIDSAGVLTLDSGAAINLEPASGSAILLDGTISIDAGVVTGATSITIGDTVITDGVITDSTGLAIAANVTVTGNILPNADDTYDLGSASAAWQDIFLEGDITLSDAGTIATSAGALTLTSAAAATWTVGGGDLTLDVTGDIILDADGDDLVFAAAGTNLLKITNSSSDVVFQPQVDAKDIKFNQYDGRTLLDINDGGYVGLHNGATGPGELRIYEDTDLGSHYTGFKAGNATASVSYVLPLADGTDGYALTTNGSGTLSWSEAGGASIGQAIAMSIIFGG